VNQPKEGFPPFYFFVPDTVFVLKGETLTCYAEDPEEKLQQLRASPPLESGALPAVAFQAAVPREEYLGTIRQLQQHIARGDCYEINYCVPFEGRAEGLDAATVYQRLMQASPNPFSAYYRLDEQYLICASPERYLQRQGGRLLSQPIKGTAPRAAGDALADRQWEEQLKSSAKDRAENVMVVDLVRNDLSRICTEGTVKVDELFGVYAFPQVYQMISTISGELRPGVRFSEILRATFPMGSMTGAPKFRVMELIDQYEKSGRGLFSGSVGYFTPAGDFDFNVVIRSIFYDAASGRICYKAGSGITTYSNPEAEWEECLLKGEAIRRIFEAGRKQ
jgi:para-aminobenzoate synthetase component 1